MKKYLFLLSFCLATILYANENEQPIITFEKTYVRPDEIFIGENSIIILTKTGVCMVDSIEADEKGFYGKKAYWVCPRCWTKNDLGNLDCSNCDYSLPY